MAVTKITYTAITPPTITLNSLANSAARISAAVDNTANLYDDILISLKVTTASGTLGSSLAVYLYVADSVDGTAYADNATPGDAAYTVNATNNLTLASIVNVVTAAVAAVGRGASLAALFGGSLPEKFALVVSNASGLALGASGNSLQLTGVTYTTA